MEFGRIHFIVINHLSKWFPWIAYDSSENDPRIEINVNIFFSHSITFQFLILKPNEKQDVIMERAVGTEENWICSDTRMELKGRG